LPATPLLSVLRQAPDGHDSDVWADVDTLDDERHLRIVPDRLSAQALRAHVATASMERLDLAHPPFEIRIFDHLEEGGAALYVKMHHAVADGIGFQTILGLLSDKAPAVPWPDAAAPLPAPDTWRALADARFAAEADRAEAHKGRRKEALAAIKVLESDDSSKRATTPVFGLSGPTSARRAYTTASLPLARIKAAGSALGGTVNDIFLAVAATALRDALIAIGQLPDQPIVINSARSYRREAEHGRFGNRIAAIHPHLATTIADPVERLRAIQTSMAAELRRTPLDEAMLDQPEKPGGAAARREAFAQRTSGGAAVLPGNITLSNVPGPAGDRFFAGYRQRANHPVPLLGSGRFLNITSRRNGDRLDFGIMADPEKLPDVAGIAQGLERALALYESLAPRG
ncbi:MAG: wax ester/triacylglycerol synthase domain-containing protein, partial [Sphingobium sp.]